MGAEEEAAASLCCLHKVADSIAYDYPGSVCMRLAPLCPLLSVLIGAGFLAFAQACEALALPTAWLNWPVYYGTLYGPFASVYVSVKAAARTHVPLPS